MGLMRLHLYPCIYIAILNSVAKPEPHNFHYWIPEPFLNLSLFEFSTTNKPRGRSRSRIIFPFRSRISMMRLSKIGSNVYFILFGMTEKCPNEVKFIGTFLTANIIDISYCKNGFIRKINIIMFISCEIVVS
jgi:hypothetical protein